MANAEAPPVSSWPEKPDGWRTTWRDPKPRAREPRAVETPRKTLSGPIPPPEAVRDEALRTLLDLLRDGENEPCRFAAAMRGDPFLKRLLMPICITSSKAIQRIR